MTLSITGELYSELPEDGRPLDLEGPKVSPHKDTAEPLGLSVLFSEPALELSPSHSP